MGDAVENDLVRRRLSSSNRVLPGVPVQKDVQFGHFRDPAAIDFTVELDSELHDLSLPPAARVESGTVDLARGSGYCFHQVAEGACQRAPTSTPR